MKKIISYALAIALFAALLPFSALAETTLDDLTAEQLTNNLPGLLTENLTLPSEISGTKVNWSSSDPSVIDTDGVVTRDTFEKKSATLTAATAAGQKDFIFTVAPMTTNVIYQDAFYYPAWLNQDFLTPTSGNTIGWSKRWASVNNHRITKTTNASGQDTYALQKDGNITERTIYTLSKSPDTLTLSFDVYYDIDAATEAIYDYYFYLGDDSCFYFRQYLTSTNAVEIRLYDTGRQQRAGSSDASYNIRKQWFTITMELNQSQHTLTLKIADKILCKDVTYGTTEARLSKLQLQPGSKATCGALMLDNISLVEYKNRETYLDETAVEKTLESICSDTFTGQSSYAVTKNLNLCSDAMKRLLTENGTSVDFTSSNTSALSIQNTGSTVIGLITPQLSEQAVTLTATVSKGCVSKAKNISFTVPAKEAYVFDSEGFGEPSCKNQYLSALERWSGSKDDKGFYSKITEEQGSYCVDSKRDASSSANYYSYSFAGLRKTKTLSVEMTVTYKEQTTGGTFYYDFEFYGKDSDNRADSVNRIGYVRINAGTIRAYANPTATSYSTARAAVNSSNRLRFEFDFDAQSYDLYVDGQKINKAPMPFPASFSYAALDHFSFTAFRTMTGAHFRLDDFVVKSDHPSYMSSYFDDVYQRPLKLTLGSYNTQPLVSVTSEYDKDNLLKQNFILLHAGSQEKNVHFDFKGAYLRNKSTGSETCLLENVISDETTPININGLYLGANHGAHGVKVTSANHGKTAADIGSLWKASDNQQWTLLRIIDNNTLLFLAEIGSGTDKTFAFPGKIAGAALTYVSHGANTSDLPITAQEGAYQVYPSIANVNPKLYLVRDNVKTEVADLYAPSDIACDEVVMEISYDIMNPALIGTALRSIRPENGFDEAPSLALGEPLIRYHLWMTVGSDGTVLTEFDHEILKDLSSIEYYGHQWYPRADAYGGGVYRYLPGTKAFSAKPYNGDVMQNFDFSTPYNMKNVFPGSTSLTKDAWSEPDTYVPDRIVDYMRGSNGENMMAYAAGYVPIYDAAPDARLKNATSSVFLYGSKKAYPMFINSKDFTQAGAHIKGATYRKYEDLSAQTSAAEIYTINHDEDVYYYIDFLTAVDETLDLSEKNKIYNPEIIYKSGNASCTITGDIASISGSAKDYIVISAKRGLELTDAIYNPQTRQATVRIYNYSSQIQSVVLIAAAYKDGKLKKCSEPIPLTLDSDAVSLKDIDINTEDAEKITFYVWDGTDTLRPLGKAKTIKV